MATPSQDLVSTIDFTAVNPLTGDILNTAQSSLTPSGVFGDVSQGLGLTIVTYDSALGVPVVPDVTGTGNSKWERYAWIRMPHATDTNRRATIYAWNKAVTADPTYQNWITTREDTGPLYTALATLTASVNTASANASQALLNANNALLTANTANSNVTTAINNAASAQAAATTANTNATTALNTATTAQATATSALATANNAIGIANGNVAVTKLLPGTAGQQYRVKADGTAVEWFSRVNTIAILQYIVAAGTNGENLASGAFTDRLLNTVVTDPGVIETLASNQITLAAGSYRIKAELPVVLNSANKTALVQSKLYNVSDAADVAFSLNLQLGTANAANSVTTAIQVIDTVVTITSNKTYKFQTYQSGGTINVYGGLAASIGANEYYSRVVIEKIG